MLKLNSKGISHILIPLMVVVIGIAAFGTYQLVGSDAASKKCKVRETTQGSVLYARQGGGWYGYARVYVDCNFRGGTLTDNTVSICKLDSRTNPRDHGPCYKGKSANSIGGGAYDLRVEGPSKGRAPSALKLVVITNPGDKPHYGFVTLRQR